MMIAAGREQDWWRKAPQKQWGLWQVWTQNLSRAWKSHPAADILPQRELRREPASSAFAPAAPSPVARGTRRDARWCL